MIDDESDADKVSDAMGPGNPPSPSAPLSVSAANVAEEERGLRPGRRAIKPSKPYPDFPLYAHKNRQWAKTIRGKTYYFGRWEDWKEALARFRHEADDLYAGRKPRRDRTEFITVRDLFNRYLAFKEGLLDAGEIAPRTFESDLAVCKRVVKYLDSNRAVDDLRPDDFEKLRFDLAKTRGPTSLCNDITRIRMVFKYAFDTGLIASPMRFGPGLKKPSKRVLRAARNVAGPRMFTAEEIVRILGAAPLQLKAMVLLGINCGFGNDDCGRLTLASLDLENGWHNFWRPKTNNPRRCPLWPETVEALRNVISARLKRVSEKARDYVFVTAKGNCWSRDDSRTISMMFRKLQMSLGVYRKGVTTFYSLRRTFETVGGESLDQVAVDFIMGHIAPSDDMSVIYRQSVSDERLVAVTNRVHSWLFGSAAQ